MANGNGQNGSKKNFKALEKTLHEAFAYAQARRKDMDLPLLAGTERETRQGLKWVGPRSYKTTVWWSPAEYVDLLRAKQAMKFRGGLLAFIRHLTMEMCPHVASAPRPIPRAERAMAKVREQALARQQARKGRPIKRLPPPAKRLPPAKEREHAQEATT